MLSKRRYGWPGERLARVAQIGPAMERWREIVENGKHEFQRDFAGVTLTIQEVGCSRCMGLRAARRKARYR